MALGFVRFAGASSFIPGAIGPGYLAALHRAADTTDYGNGAAAGAGGLFGYLLTGTNTTTGASATTYQLPEGKSFVIGSLGAGTQVGGVLGAAGGGTATLLGAGTNLFGFTAGDVNIHANAASDSQTLSLFTRSTTDTLVLGRNGVPVVFTPTWGDSGASSAITLMRDRTGATTLTKLGAGTLVLSNVAYRSLTGSDVRGSFTWQVNAGTLSYQQVDTGANFAGFTVTNATLTGTGKINGAVTIQSNGTLSPGGSPGVLSVGNLTLATNSVFKAEWNGLTLGAQYDNVNVSGGVTLDGGQLLVTLGFTPSLNDSFLIISNDLADAVSGRFFGLGQGGSLTVGSTVFQINYLGGSGNDVVLTVIPEPSALALVGAGVLLLLAFRHRSRR